MLQISQALVSVESQLCLVPCDVPCGCLGLLTLICHVADFTNTFRSLASVQPEDSSADLPGPLQEVGAAYSCLSHVAVCPLTPLHPLPISLCMSHPCPQAAPFALVPYAFSFGPCLFVSCPLALPFRPSPSATVFLQPLPVPAQAIASWYEDVGSCLAHHNTANLIRQLFQSCAHHLQRCCSKHQYSRHRLYESYQEAEYWCSTIGVEGL